MGHYKSNVRDLEFNLFEVLGLDKPLSEGAVGRSRRRHRPRHAVRGRAPRRGPARRVLRRHRPQSAGLRPRDARGDPAGVLQEVVQGDVGRRVVPHGPERGDRRRSGSAHGGVGHRRDAAGRTARRVHVPGRPVVRGRALRQRHRRAEAVGGNLSSSAAGAPPWCSPSPTPAPTSAPDAPRPSSRTTAPGTSRASSASSLGRPRTTCSRTSSTWCSRAPRAPDRAPRA